MPMANQGHICRSRSHGWSVGKPLTIPPVPLGTSSAPGETRAVCSSLIPSSCSPDACDPAGGHNWKDEGPIQFRQTRILQETIGQREYGGAAESNGQAFKVNPPLQLVHLAQESNYRDRNVQCRENRQDRE